MKKKVMKIGEKSKKIKFVFCLMLLFLGILFGQVSAEEHNKTDVPYKHNREKKSTFYGYFNKLICIGKSYYYITRFAYERDIFFHQFDFGVYSQDILNILIKGNSTIENILDYTYDQFIKPVKIVSNKEKVYEFLESTETIEETSNFFYNLYNKIRGYQEINDLLKTTAMLTVVLEKTTMEIYRIGEFIKRDEGFNVFLNYTIPLIEGYTIFYSLIKMARYSGNSNYSDPVFLYLYIMPEFFTSYIKNLDYALTSNEDINSFYLNKGILETISIFLISPYSYYRNPQNNLRAISENIFLNSILILTVSTIEALFYSGNYSLSNNLFTVLLNSFENTFLTHFFIKTILNFENFATLLATPIDFIKDVGYTVGNIGYFIGTLDFAGLLGFAGGTLISLLYTSIETARFAATISNEVLMKYWNNKLKLLPILLANIYIYTRNSQLQEYANNKPDSNSNIKTENNIVASVSFEIELLKTKNRDGTMFDFLDLEQKNLAKETTSAYYMNNEYKNHENRQAALYDSNITRIERSECPAIVPYSANYYEGNQPSRDTSKLTDK